MTELTHMLTGKVVRVNGRLCDKTCDHLREAAYDELYAKCALTGRVLLPWGDEHRRCGPCQLEFGIPVQFAGGEIIE